MVVDPVGTDVGLALTVEWSWNNTGTSNSMVAGGDGVRGIPSVVSVAFRVTVSATVSVTVKLTWPLLSDTVEVGLTTLAELDGVVVRSTVLPGTGMDPVPSRLTVTVETSAPSAVTVDGAATTIESAADGVVGVVAADPSPGFSPRSSLFFWMKKGCDQTWGEVKSFWLSPMKRMHSVATVLPHAGPVVPSPRRMLSGNA
jgi:hypothetical protein